MTHYVRFAIAAVALGLSMIVSAPSVQAQVQSACRNVDRFCATHLGSRCSQYAGTRYRDVPIRCAQQVVYYDECQEMARSYCATARSDRRWERNDGRRDGGWARDRDRRRDQGARGWVGYSSITVQGAGALRANQSKDHYVAHPGGCMIIRGEVFEPGSHLIISYSDNRQRVLDLIPDPNGIIKAQMDLEHAGFLASVHTGPGRGSSFRFLIGAAPVRCQTRY